jgi:hypothetical protein
MKIYFRLFFLASLVLAGCDEGGRYACPKSSDLINLQDTQRGTTFVADGHTWIVHYAQGYIALKAIEQLRGPEKITDASKLTALGLSKGQFACQYTRTIFGKVHAILYLRPAA